MHYLLFFLFVHSTSIDDFDLAGLQKQGPFESKVSGYSLKFNVDKAIGPFPENLSSCGELDSCTVCYYMPYASYCCGDSSVDNITILPNNEGYVVASYVFNGVHNSVITVFCSETTSVNAEFGNDVYLGVSFYTPFGCPVSHIGLCKTEDCCNNLSAETCLVSGSCYMKSGLCVYDKCLDSRPTDSHGCPPGCVATDFHETQVSDGTEYYYDEAFCTDSEMNTTPNVNVCVMLSDGDRPGVCEYVAKCHTRTLKQGDFCVMDGILPL